MTDQPVLVFRKSSRSGNSGGGWTGQCVEVADLPDGGRVVRHSTDPGGPTLTFTGAEWTAFVEGVKLDEFN